MKSKTPFIGLAAAVIGLLIVGVVLFTNGGYLLEKPEVSDEQPETNGSVSIGDNATVVTPSEDELLGKYEKSDKLFERTERHGRIIYWHNRMIEDAFVEKDQIVYIFNMDGKKLIEKRIHWRDDLPEHLPRIITKEQAESIAGGGSATLYFISPESHLVPIKPTPENPCWEVWKVTETDDYGTIYFINLCSLFLTRCVDHEKFELQTLFESIFQLNGDAFITNDEKRIELGMNSKEPELMDKLNKSLRILNTRVIRDPDGRSIQFNM
ncbi:MAG: hypothetical protein U9Q68_02520 [Euryarchaeota archaeon]|nr:hypothetical protein [Euryarchaeota archaeon]